MHLLLFEGRVRRLDEVFATISGQRHNPWRAVDQDSNALDIFVQRHRYFAGALAGFSLRFLSPRFTDFVA
jgi:transposase-like protein